MSSAHCSALWLYLGGVCMYWGQEVEPMTQAKDKQAMGVQWW
jgi:hypothetical protein